MNDRFIYKTRQYFGFGNKLNPNLINIIFSNSIVGLPKIILLKKYGFLTLKVTVSVENSYKSVDIAFHL